MREFILGTNTDYPFVLFSATHYLWIIIPIVVICFMHKYRDKLYNLSCKTKRRISLMFVIFMLLNIEFYHLSKVIYGAYDWKVHLPFHFCFISGYLFMYAVLFKKKGLYKITYFLAYMGTIPTMLMPDLKESFDSFIFYSSFISHHVFMIGIMFIYYAYNFKIDFRDMINTFKLANVIFGVMFIFNMIFGTNYIMQKELPNHVLELLPFLYNFNYPIIVLELTGIIVMFIAYIPIYFNKQKQNDIHSLEYN